MGNLYGFSRTAGEGVTLTRGEMQFAVQGEGRPEGRALRWLMVLTPFFFLTYGFANWAATQRAYVPSIVFGWEHHIPFFAWSIVPYSSTDFLYAASLFVCRINRELTTHLKRLISAQLISVCVFLVFPLRFTFGRPHPAGLFGSMFDLLTTYDQP